MVLDAPSWLPGWVIPFFPIVQLAGIIALIIWSTSGMIFIPWAIWVRMEQKMALDSKTQEYKSVPTWLPRLFMWSMVCFLPFMVCKTVQDGSLTSNLTSDHLAFLFCLSVTMTWLSPLVFCEPKE